MYIKYFCNKQFDCVGFAKLLVTRMNVRAYAVDDGVIMDLDAFHQVKAYEMPMWAYQNKRFLQGDALQYHTRQATKEEAKRLDNMGKYQLIIRSQYKDFDLGDADSLAEILTVLNGYKADLQRRNPKLVYAVLEQKTGEVVVEL